MKQSTGFLALCLAYYVSLSLAQNNLNRTSAPDNSFREGKLFPVFQIVKFRNEGCSGSNARNGTCYTQSECTSRGGKASGTCASGYGICCIFSMTCGSTASENCTYLTQMTATAPIMNPCTYKICKSDPKVCRIRLDFQTFQIADPNVGTVVEVGLASVNNGDTIGKCLTDTFTLTAPGSFTPPLICGYNKDQHMIVDASDMCHLAIFTLSGSATRSWDIKVTQYQCGNTGLGGDPGCLQFFTGKVGRVASFAFPTSTAVLTPQTTHLANQCYTMCWRQEAGMCGICYTPAIVGTLPVISSFGLSNPTKGKAKGEIDRKCNEDYLQIPLAQAISTSSGELSKSKGKVVLFELFVVTSEIALDVNFVDRICGRQFSAATDRPARETPGTVCTQSKPFRMIFKTDETEQTVQTDKAQTNEQFKFPGGIVGFNLDWELQACT